MDKILLINKEKGYTSRDVVNKISKHFNERKVGHFGTLDPLATGLLVIGMGAYTKLGNLLSDESKCYIATVLVGKSTDTYDITGNTLSISDDRISLDEIISALDSFKGTYNQEVPIYSAVKVNGKKLYEYARSSKSVDLPRRDVTIYDISFINTYEKDGNQYFTFFCHVSKGTYIRSLVNDISKKIGVLMCMSDLERVKCGNLSISSSYTISDVLNDEFSFLDVGDVLDLERREVPVSLRKKIFNGSLIDSMSSKYILFTHNGKDIALYGKYKDFMKPYLVFKND